MTTAVWIAEASVGQVQGQVQDQATSLRRLEQSSGHSHKAYASLLLIGRERAASGAVRGSLVLLPWRFFRLSRGDGVAFYIGAASVMACVFSMLSAT